MNIGIPIERKSDEYRVGLTPQGVELLTQAGHTCYVERGAGRGAGFSDAVYERAGGRVVYSTEEVYGRADMVLKVGEPQSAELEAAREGQTICAFWHLASRSRSLIKSLIDKRITTVAYESIQDAEGMKPVLQPLSQIAGRMLPQIAARWLQNDGGGDGRSDGGTVEGACGAGGGGEVSA